MRALGCTYGQGFYFAHPVADSEMARLDIRPALAVPRAAAAAVPPVGLRRPSRKRRPSVVGNAA